MVAQRRSRQGKKKPLAMGLAPVSRPMTLQRCAFCGPYSSLFTTTPTSQNLSVLASRSDSQILAAVEIMASGTFYARFMLGHVGVTGKTSPSLSDVPLVWLVANLALTQFVCLYLMQPLHIWMTRATIHQCLFSMRIVALVAGELHGSIGRPCQPLLCQS